MDKIEIINYVPKFLKFYKLASKENIDSENRWNLWKEHYNFAAIPPGPDGQKLARELLDNAWEKYPEKLSYLEKFKPNLNDVEKYLKEIKSLFDCKDMINVIVIYFVGGFENNPFVARYDEERLALCLPIECGDSKITLSHELTHVVHSKTANLKSEWKRTIASTILQEGLALQVSKYLIPGKADEEYIEHKEGWLDSCKSKKNEIIKGVLPYLNDSSSEIVYKFTFGNGTTNIDREVYFVGWEVVDYLIKKGIKFKDIANIQEDKMPDYLKEVFSNLLN